MLNRAMLAVTRMELSSKPLRVSRVAGPVGDGTFEGSFRLTCQSRTYNMGLWSLVFPPFHIRSVYVSLVGYFILYGTNVKR